MSRALKTSRSSSCRMSWALKTSRYIYIIQQQQNELGAKAVAGHRCFPHGSSSFVESNQAVEPPARDYIPCCPKPGSIVFISFSSFPYLDGTLWMASLWTCTIQLRHYSSRREEHYPLKLTIIQAIMEQVEEYILLEHKLS